MSECTGVAVFILRERDGAIETLLLKRAGGGFEEEWCPVAGTVEPGEEAGATVQREAAEETGLRLRELEASEIRVYRSPQRDGPHIRIYSAWVEADAEVRLNYEHSDFAWCSFERARELVSIDAQRTALEEIERIRTRGEPARFIEFRAPDE